MLVHPEGFYAAQKIDLRLGVQVDRVDTKQARSPHDGGRGAPATVRCCWRWAPCRDEARPPVTTSPASTNLRQQADSTRSAPPPRARATPWWSGPATSAWSAAFTLQQLGLAVTLIEASARGCFSASRGAGRFRRSSRPRRSAAWISVCARTTRWSGFVGGTGRLTSGIEGRSGEGSALRTWWCLPAGVAPSTDFLKDSG